MVKVSRFAVNPKYPTKITEGFEEIATRVLNVNIAIPVSESGFMVSYPYMDYNRSGSVNYATMSHIVPTDLPNPIGDFVKDSIVYNKMLEDRIRKSQDMYYEEVATAINNSPTLSKMNIPVSSPMEVENFTYMSTSSMSKNRIAILLIGLIAVLGIGYMTLRKKD